MKLIILFLSLLTFSLAQSIVNIDSDKSNITNFKLDYIINKTSNLAFEDIKSMQFTQGRNKDSLGAEVTDVWIKITVFNSSKNKQILFLHQDIAYTFISMEYFEVDNSDTLLNKQMIAPFYSQAKEQLSGADAIYEFTLNAQETKTIYIHQISPAYHFYNFSIFSQKESIEYLISQKVDSVLMVGLLMAFALYNLFIYFSSGYKEYLYYFLYLSSGTLWIFYVYGAMAHYLHLYGEIPLRFNFGMMFVPIFLALFIQSIFNTKIKYKKEHHFLNSIIVILSITIIYGLINFNHALQLLALGLNYSMLVFLGIAISIYKKGNKIIKIFLFAHTFYLVFNIYALLFYLGLVDFTYISSHGMGIGIGIEALMLSYLVSYKFKVMQQEKEEDRLKKIDLRLLASTDPMTKLYNRRYFMEVSENIMSLSKRKKWNLSIIMFDIDNFKNINDTYGHKIGDDVIIALADKFMELTRKSDIVARFGGEEFLILLPETDIEKAFFIAEKIRFSVQDMIIYYEDKKELKFTLSAGVSLVDNQKDKNIEDSIHRADKALYEAKRNGKNRICMK